MASSYALPNPVSDFPPHHNHNHNHNHNRRHGHPGRLQHSHAQSQSHPLSQSQSPLQSSQTQPRLPSSSLSDAAPDTAQLSTSQTATAPPSTPLYGRADQARAIEHNQSQFRANTSHVVTRQPVNPTAAPPPISLGSHWRTASSSAATLRVTPADSSLQPVVEYYRPPEPLDHYSHDHDHPDDPHNHHDHHDHYDHYDHPHDHYDHPHDPYAHHLQPTYHLPSDPRHSGPRSRFTDAVLSYATAWPLLHAIVVEKDSRRIFYFMMLNFGFMIVQAFYGYVTDSLGLLSDSIHMFFDCVALAVGLFAAVASKWPPTERFPYGFGKIETLSGFGNGVFLVLISVEIMSEAFERILEGRETKRLGELIVVSTLGLLVNVVGMLAFGHHHHGHSHGHSHGPHAHEGHSTDCNSHGRNHDHNHHDQRHDHGHDHGHEKNAHAHDHDHDNDNMYGIYLHVLADTLGSAAVIVSTILIRFTGWAGWDPVASFLIAALIILSAIPLVRSSAVRLLLTVPDGIEYGLRDTLSGLCGLRGVAGYATPRFWLDNRGDSSVSAGKPARPSASLEEKAGERGLVAVIHIIAARGAQMDDVRDRVRTYLLGKGIDVVVQVEREGDPNCWCGAGRNGLGLSNGKSFGGGSFGGGFGGSVIF